ncbi:hypothetical protein [Variovorax sp. YR752]|uniref:hypothetical protein n=1 Tax=Variovorax sp. YR752 TaxID=1884383 RepID=UPI00313775A6
MRSVFRILLLWLMAVALPLQGFAATGAQHCAPMHERMQVMEAHDLGHGDHHHAAAVDVDVQAEALDHPMPDPAAKTGAFKCSACAACCVALGLPVSAMELPGLPADGLQPSAPEAGIVAFLTDGLERPPRTVLA